MKIDLWSAAQIDVFKLIQTKTRIVEWWRLATICESVCVGAVTMVRLCCSVYLHLGISKDETSLIN